MNGFEFVNMADYGLTYVKYTTDLLPYCSHEVISIMKKIGIHAWYGSWKGRKMGG